MQFYKVISYFIQSASTSESEKHLYDFHRSKKPINCTSISLKSNRKLVSAIKRDKILRGFNFPTSLNGIFGI